MKKEFFLRKYKLSATLSEGALIKMKMIFPIVLKGVVHWFIFTKGCFIGRF